MTRKDYVAIAYALASTRPSPTDGPSARPQWERTREAVSLILKKDNDRFDVGKFYRATEL